MRKIIFIQIGLLMGAFILVNSFGQNLKGIRRIISPFSSHPEIGVDLNRQYALIIGINEYKKLSPLNNSVYDAWNLKEILIDNYGYKKENIIELYNEAATYRNIRSKLRGFLDDLKPDDSLLIYFSGHGHKDKKLKQGYWVPYDAGTTVETETISILNEAIMDEIPRKIPNHEIRDTLNECKAKHIFIVSDSCYSAELVMFKQVIQKTLPESFKLPSRQVLASGSARVSDGIMGNHSPFARYFLKYLQQNTNSYFMGINIIAYTKTAVVSNPEGIKQEPFGGPLIRAGHEGGEFYFFLRKKYQPEESVSSHLAEGDRAFKKGNYEQAEKHYSKILKKFPNDLYARKRIDICRYKKKYSQTTMPRELIEKIYKGNPHLPPENYLGKLIKDSPNHQGYWEAKIDGHIMVFIPKSGNGIGGFFVDKYEVSFAQLETVSPFKSRRKLSNKELIKKSSSGYPAVVSYNEAESYCRSKGFRLLKEEEWEYIAGKSRGNVYPWGTEMVDAFEIFRANYDDRMGRDDGYKALAPVDSFEAFASPFGIVNLAGNAWEWVQGNICKGGGFMSKKEDLKITSSSDNEAIVGFRCAVDVKQ
jgi:hypothetical protein